jgi:hypothetical protein
VKALLHAAQQLYVLEVSLRDYLDEARRVLRNDAPFGPVCVRDLTVYGDDSGGEDDLLMLAADMSTHVGLMALTLSCLPLKSPAALDAVADAALASRVSSLELTECDVSPAYAPALARRIGGGALTALSINNIGYRLLDDDTAVVVLCDALRASSTLTSLSLWFLWDEPAATAALLGALTGHPSLQTLRISADFVEASAALGELVAANAPSFVHLDVSWCRLGDDGMGPLFDALPHNTHLRSLKCCENNITEAFMRDRLLPAVRANSSLRKLGFGDVRPAGEVAALMASRAAAAAAAQ